MATESLRHLATGLNLRYENHFGIGSVEVTPAKPQQGEGAVRRLAITSHELVDRPHPGVFTIPDVIDYTVKKYGTNYNAVAWRDVIKLHEEVREITKVVDGREVKQSKTWKLYELTKYKYMNFVEFRDAIVEVRNGLLKLGIAREDVVNVYAQTSVNWQLMAHACASISTTIATAYDTLGVKGLTHSVTEPDCLVIFTNSDLLPTLAQAIPNTPKLKFVFYDGAPSPNVLEKMQSVRDDVQYIHLDEIRSLGRTLPQDEQLSATLEQRRPTADTLACIMYTSGSTGTPKGVCITHGNLIASISSVTISYGPHVPAGDIFVAYLPLAHVMEFIVELCALFVGVTLGYARPKTLTDAGVKNCRGDLFELKAQIMFGVPSVWETIRKGIVGKINEGGALKKALFYSALAAKKRGIPFLSTLGESIVLSKVREATGGNLKFAMSGGAPLNEDTQHFLSAVLMPIMQGYGMTESCGMCTLLPPERIRFGAVGLPVPSIEVKLLDIPALGYAYSNNPPQGEVCIRGPSVFKSYFKRPDLNSDSSIWTEDGWFRTGDVGQWNEDGTLSLIDRVKNLVKMQNGEYIALEKLESIYKSCDLVSNLCVHVSPGAASPIAVIFPHEVNLRYALSLSTDPALAHIQDADLASLCAHPYVKQLLLKDCNEIGAKNGLKGAEVLVGAIITPEEWTPETGLVTAAQKIQRNAVALAFEKEIEAMYSSL